jgi:phage terminase large subunit-like protein
MEPLNPDKYVEECWRKAKYYCEGIENGSIISNKYIKLAIQRHKQDLLRPDLEWKPIKVERVFKFFSYLFVDKNEQLRLEPFQAFILMTLFGFYFKNTEIRKYLYAFLFIARKNGKTTLSSALQLYFMLGDEVSFPQSVLIASSVAQVNKTAFKELSQIVKSSPALHKRLEVQRNRIIFKDRERIGSCEVVPAIEDRLEGLNPTSCILDEVHTYDSPQKFNVIKNALGTKKNPMLFLISTAGNDENSFCAELVNTGKNVLNGLSEDDRFFYLLYHIENGDDWKDEKCWIKANPGLGTILSSQVLKDQLKTSISLPSSRFDFVTKRMNIFRNDEVQWIPDDMLFKVTQKYDESILEKQECYIGIDLSSTRDLTAVVCLFLIKGKFYVKPYFFFANNEEKIYRKNGININNWVDSGHIIKCQSSTIDYELLYEKIIEISQKYDIRAIYYDKFNSALLIPKIQIQLGNICKSFNQTAMSFNQPLKYLEKMIFDGEIEMGDNPVLVWNVRNAVLYIDGNENIKIMKNKSKDSVDGIVALGMAMGAYIDVNTDAEGLAIENLLKYQKN